jgi:cytochrome c oxidase subunit II
VSRARAVVATLVVIAVAGCVPAPVTAEGRSINDLYRVLLILAAIVAAIVLFLAIVPIVRWRRRGQTALPPQEHGSRTLELIWTGIPILTIIGIFALTVGVLDRIDTVPSGQPTIDVRVEAFRWGWRFSYPADGVVLEGIVQTGPELVVPVGETVQVTITGDDVVHAFFVPQFLFKRDAIPGRETTFQFTVDEPGTYRGQCAEFCGVGHPQMPFTVRAVPRADYETWLATAPRPSPAS